MDVPRLMQAALGDAGTSPAADPCIRPAQSDDLRQWRPLHRSLFAGSDLPDGEIAAAISDGPRLVLTAWLDGWPAGGPVAKDDPAGDGLCVDRLGVDLAARGRRGAALTVRQHRAEALSRYPQCGFQR